jgi:hypothetical protein
VAFTFEAATAAAAAAVGVASIRMKSIYWLKARLGDMHIGEWLLMTSQELQPLCSLINL